MYYDNAALYIESVDGMEAKIIAIDAVINALMGVALTAAANENISEYSLDDGQTKIRSMYRGTAAIFASIQSFERLKQMYINRLNGRMVRLTHGDKFI